MKSKTKQRLSVFIVVVDKRFMIRKKRVAGGGGGGGGVRGRGGGGVRGEMGGGGGGQPSQPRGQPGLRPVHRAVYIVISGRKGAVGMYEDYKHED